MDKIVDLANLKSISLLQEKPDIPKEVLTRFQFQSERLLTEIKSAIDSKDVETIFHCCHKLKGSAQTIGAIALAAECDRLQVLSEKDNPDFTEVAATHFRARDAFGKTRNILQREI